MKEYSLEETKACLKDFATEDLGHLVLLCGNLHMLGVSRVSSQAG